MAQALRSCDDGLTGRKQHAGVVAQVVRGRFGRKLGMARDACAVCDPKAACLDDTLTEDERLRDLGGPHAAGAGEASGVPGMIPPHDHQTYSPGCQVYSRVHARRVTEWRTRRQFDETTNAS